MSWRQEKTDNTVGLARPLELGGLEVRTFISRKKRIQYFSDHCMGHFELNCFFRLVPSFSSCKVFDAGFFHICEILNFRRVLPHALKTVF